MKFAEYLAQILPETTIDHLATLRQELYAAGLIKKPEQEALYTEAAKMYALDWYKKSLKETDKGYYGKLFEVTARIMWSIYHNRPMDILDIKARPAGVADMRIMLGGKRYEIELKTATGNLAQGATPAEALQKLAKLASGNKLIVWDYRKDGCPIAMPARDFFQMLEDYNGNVETWFTLNRDTNGSWGVKLQPISKKKAQYLDDMSGNGYDWETTLQTGELE
jgi:hypothetical protein